MRVLAEITEANRIGASADDIHELFLHASELLEIMDEEIENEPEGTRAHMRSAAATMRARLGELDRDVRPPRHQGGGIGQQTRLTITDRLAFGVCDD